MQVEGTLPGQAVHVALPSPQPLHQLQHVLLLRELHHLLPPQPHLQDGLLPLPQAATATLVPLTQKRLLLLLLLSLQLRRQIGRDLVGRRGICSSQHNRSK